LFNESFGQGSPSAEVWPSAKSYQPKRQRGDDDDGDGAAITTII